MIRNKLKTIFILIIISSLLLPINSTVKSLTQDIQCNYASLTENVSGENALKYLEKLCSDEFEGRQAGTEGSWKTANWIADLFKGFGLKPGGDKFESYFQEFSVPLFNIVSPTNFSIMNSKNESHVFTYKSEYAIAPGSGSGSVSADIIFAGYGITSPNDHYDDYQGIDVQGKIVLIMRKSPTFTEFNSSHLLFSTKIENAQKHGATGIIIAEKSSEKILYTLNTKSVTGNNGTIPALFVKTETANTILTEIDTDLLKLEKKIDETRKPNSFNVKSIGTINVKVESKNVKTANVIGYMEGSNKDTNETVIITAHYDHLGKDEIDGAIYRGANDNASGTAVLLEFARALSSNCIIPKVNIVFIAFSGEEEGLLGSYFYVKNPIFPLNKTYAVLNMDMVGTGDGDLIAGTDPAKYTDLGDAVTKSDKCLNISTPFSKNLLSSGSDQYYFNTVRVPTVFFIRSNPSGLGGYHSTDDTVDSIDPVNLEETGKMVFMIIAIYTTPTYVSFNQSYWQKGLDYHPRIVFSGSTSNDVILKINDKLITISDDLNYGSVYNVKNGENSIDILIYKENDVIFEKIFKINAEIDKNLICDLNFDYKVDLNDLIIFSEKYDEKVIPSTIGELYDFNSDGVINKDDLSYFNSNLGYIHKEI